MPLLQPLKIIQQTSLIQNAVFLSSELSAAFKDRWNDWWREDLYAVKGPPFILKMTWLPNYSFFP